MAENPRGRPMMTAARFIRPLRIEGEMLVGMIWDSGARREVEIKASLPRNVEPDRALEAAAAGQLVLTGFNRLGWARG